MSKHLDVNVRVPIEKGNPAILRYDSLCIKCGQCRDVCQKQISVGQHYDLLKTNDTAICIHCGQCANVCPTHAIKERQDFMQAKDAMRQGKKTVFITSPSVRVAIGEEFGMEPGSYVEEKMVAALRALGADYVFDTTFAADLTIMEEASELIDRIQNNKPLPQFTSCCPAWVKFITDQYKDYIPNLSTCRSPQGMLSAVIKEYFREPEHAAGKKTVMISIMPCTAKKAEAIRPNSFTDGEQDTDIVITTTELLRMIDNFGIDFAALDPEACDMPFGFGSGGGVIFGVTGGVTEAVLRRLTPDHSKESMHEIAECGVRGDDGIKEFTVPYEGMNLNICVASGLANARKVMDQVKNGEKEYHLIEVMACRRGCIMGGGQPTRAGDRTKFLRAKGLYNADNTTIIKKSDENPLVLELYNGLLKGKEHHLLHNDSY